jgi:hypothetical protein
MPTYERTPEFVRDLRSLNSHQRALDLSAVRQFAQDLRTRRFWKGLRVKVVRGHEGVFEMT